MQIIVTVSGVTSNSAHPPPQVAGHGPPPTVGALCPHLTQTYKISQHAYSVLQHNACILQAQQKTSYVEGC